MKHHNLIIIIVNYNGFTDTKACLSSINATIGEQPYVVLVDNGSKSPERLEELRKDYTALHIIYNSTNIGFGRANNVGIRWAQKNIDFDYLLLLNNDTVVQRDSFFHLQKAFDKDDNIGVATGKIMYSENRDIVWYGGGDFTTNRIWPYIYDINRSSTLNGADKEKYVTFVSGCLMMFTSKSLRGLKGFDEEFFMYCEDLELCLRARKMGYSLYYEPKSLIFHKVQGSSRVTGSKRTGYHPDNPNLEFLYKNMQINLWKAYEKNMNGKELIYRRFLYSLDLIAKNFKFIMRGNFTILKLNYYVIKSIIKWKN